MNQGAFYLLSVNLFLIQKLLIKIIHSAAFFTFGDKYFHNNPVADELRNVLWVQSSEEVKQSHLKGKTFCGLGDIKRILPDAQPYEHAVTIICLNGMTTGIVSLFGNSGFFTALIQLAPNNWLIPSNGVMEGYTYIIDSQKREMRRIDLLQRITELGSSYPPGMLPPELLNSE
ncbi:hypothetical protein HZB01_05175 [Candidatus Woesearchaeota archaeon]|nr:hypothetical protein [Candidatus Woesearchaeota archaeon]